jgi:hypothetical protein
VRAGGRGEGEKTVGGREDGVRVGGRCEGGRRCEGEKMVGGREDGGRVRRRCEGGRTARGREDGEGGRTVCGWKNGAKEENTVAFSVASNVVVLTH